MEKKFEFNGTGGALFVKMLVGILLTAITAGIYGPWFAVSIYRYLADNTKIKKAQRGDLQLAFSGTGGQLFVKGLLGGLLCAITLGIYTPWFMVKLNRWVCDNAVAKAPDGTLYRLQFNGSGGALFVKMLVGILLTAITFCIYSFWFTVGLQRYFLQNTAILEGNKVIGNQDFVATGGQLFVTCLIGALLTTITFGIYSFWFQVKLFKFFASHHYLVIAGKPCQGRFDGDGFSYFIVNLVGGLLSGITFGIYTPWFIVKMTKFQLNNLVIAPRTVAKPSAA
ncbi:MAG: DUF898 family protein [Deltaproteobacteria bacterium]|nr:DUF898 family protein [Deltaproteobacteria bacterium]